MKSLSGILLLLLIPACGAADDPHYYTLVAPLTHGAKVPSTNAGVVAGDFQIEVLPVDVPAQVDTPLMIVRKGTGEITPVNSRRWIAPLPDEIRGALSNAISGMLGARDIHGASASPNEPTYRIKVIVRRFDSMLDDAADVDAVWSIRDVNTADAIPLTCEAHFSEKATGGFDGLALAHQHAMRDLATKVSATITAMRAAPTSSNSSSSAAPTVSCPR